MIKLFLLAAIFSCISCIHLNVIRSDATPPATSVETRTVQLNYFLWGLIPTSKLSVERDLCPNSNLDRLDMKMSCGDVTLSVVTLGIYIPHQATLTCIHDAGSTQK